MGAVGQNGGNARIQLFAQRRCAVTLRQEFAKVGAEIAGVVKNILGS